MERKKNPQSSNTLERFGSRRNNRIKSENVDIILNFKDCRSPKYKNFVLKESDEKKKYGNLKEKNKYNNESQNLKAEPILKPNNDMRLSAPGKKYHKQYDANIELRQVNERIKKRYSSSWADQSLLDDEEAVDFKKYSEKMKKKQKSMPVEQDLEVLSRRQGDIDKGKSKECYQNYVYNVAKDKRKPYQPRTPNKFLKMSRRAWDGMIKKWKKHIHAWDIKNFDELYAAGLDIECCKSEASSIASFKEFMGESDDNNSIDLRYNDFSEDEDTIKDARLSRKRHNADVDVEENTLEAKPNTEELHTGLTQDAFQMNINCAKKVKLCNLMKN